MRAIAGAVVFLGGCILWGCGEIASEVSAVAPQASHGSYLIFIGIVVAFAGGLIGWTGRSKAP